MFVNNASLVMCCKHIKENGIKNDKTFTLNVSVQFIISEHILIQIHTKLY